jgi:glycosyltransferase involved in cell wall biosynthesis
MRADRLILHAPSQHDELRELGVTGVPVTELFLPRFADAGLWSQEDVAAFRAQLGDPEHILLCFGIVRPYKGFDLAVDALARIVGEGHDAKLVIAGRIFDGGDDLRARIAASGVAGRVVLLDEYVPDERVPVLFRAADVALLPYRSASQSAVAQLSFTHGCPVVATAVGGLPAAIRDGVDGVLAPPADVGALAEAVVRVLRDRDTFRRNVDAAPHESSFDRYAELLLAAIDAR